MKRETKDTDLVKAKKGEVINIEEIYQNVYAECEAAIVEGFKQANMLVAEANFKLGEAIVQGSEHFSVTQLVTRLAKDLKMSERKLWYAVKFKERFDTWDDVLKEVSIETSWSKIKQEYLTDPAEDKQKDADQAHMRLCDDLAMVLANARAFKYNDKHSDSKNPKKDLEADLKKIVDASKKGDYTNKK